MEDKVAVSHYFIEDPNLAHQVEAFSYYFGDRRFRFESDAGVFSPGHVDPATDLLLHQLPALSGEVLDLGCGWGPVGTVLGALYPETARITMSDVNGRALALAERNSRANGVEAACVLSDGFEGLEGPFDAVVLNPPHPCRQIGDFRLVRGGLQPSAGKGSSVCGHPEEAWGGKHDRQAGGAVWRL